MHKRVMIRRRHLTSRAHTCEGEFSGVTCEALAGACPRCIVRVRFPVGSVPAVYRAGSIPCGERARGVLRGFDSRGERARGVISRGLLCRFLCGRLHHIFRWSEDGVR